MLASGKTFSLVASEAPVPGCTTSRELIAGRAAAATCFSLAAGTDISAESHPYDRLELVLDGALRMYDLAGRSWEVPAGSVAVPPVGEPVGMAAKTGSVYVEASARQGKGFVMNDAIKSGQVTRLADLLPYREGSIVNMDLAHNEGTKLALMSFDAGTGLQEHAAPGEALVFALEGEATIGYEGAEHTIHAGEQFKFDAGGRHYVRADKPFKMALLLMLG